MNINSNLIRVTALANGPWIFVDEVTFDGTTLVPEAGAGILMLLGLVGLVAQRRFKK